MRELTQEATDTTGPHFIPSPHSSITGDLRLHEFRSRVFGNMRMLRVWLPKGYDEGSPMHYPILYLNDGQNLFDRATAFGGVEWQVDETAERLICEQVIPPMIIVGMDHSQGERAREYIPYRIRHPQLTRPLGRKYPTFVTDEVMPFIEHQYRVARGPQHTGLGGSSLGGLIALYTAILRPGVFGRLLVESPSLFLGNRRVIKESRLFRQWPERMFLAMGGRETGMPEKDEMLAHDLLELGNVLKRAGMGDDRLRVKVDDIAGHNESAWAARFPEAMTFLYGTR